MADLAKIQFSRTTTAGKVPDKLSAGEIALNVNDGRIWTSDGTNNKELGLAKGGSIDGELNMTGAIRFPNGAYIASQDGNLYMTKSGTTGFIDALFLRKDKSDTINGKLTANGDIQSNTGMFYSNDGSHYLDLGKNGDNIANWGSYNGIWNFINTNGNGTSVSINNSTMSLGSAGDGVLKAGTIIFPAANAVDSNNDVSRGAQFVLESVDASSKNYPTGMGSLMTSVLSSVRVFQLYATSGEQGLYFRTMRNDGSGSQAWTQIYSTSNKPSSGDVGAYSKSESDGRFSPKGNFYLSGNDAHMQGSGGGYIYANGNGNTGYYINSKTAWGFDSNGNMTSGNVPIAQGGTNANNVSDARINLGFGNGINITYAIPNRTTGKPTWFKVLTMGKKVGTGSGKVQFLLSGMSNYGSGISDFSIVDVSGRDMPPKHRRSTGNSNDVTVGYVDNGDSGWDVYIKDNSGWVADARLSVISISDWGNQITGSVKDGFISGDNVTDAEPKSIIYVEPESFGSNYAGGIIQTKNEFISTNQNGLRIATSNDTNNKSVLLRNDGSNFYFLVSTNGITTGNNWNSLRPFMFDTNTGLATMSNGARITGGLSSDTLTVDKDIRTNGGWFYGNGVQINGNETISGTSTVGSLTTSGSVNLTGDNVQVNVGKNNDLALVKISGTTGKVAVGYGNAFQVIQSKNNSINTSDTFVNLMSVDGNTATIYSTRTNVNTLNVSQAANFSNTVSVSGSISTDNYLFVGGGMKSDYVPSTQGGYIGWNTPSGRGQTAFFNHKGGGGGGFTFHNSDGKTATKILDIDGSGNANFLGNVLSNKIIGKDNNHYLDMSTDNVILATYGGQFYFKNTNGNAQAQLSYSGNIYGSQWGNQWLSDYMEGRYANVTGQAFTGAVNFANNTWNKFGDDVQIGDRNVSGGLAIQGVSGDTTLAFIEKGNTTSGNSATGTKFVAAGGNLGIYAASGVNVHAPIFSDGDIHTGDGKWLYTGGISNTGNISSSGTTTTGDLLVNGTSNINGNMILSGGDYIKKQGAYVSTNGSMYSTNGYRIIGRDNTQFSDSYFNEIVGQYAYLGFHVTSGGSDGWYEFRNNGDFYTNGAGSFGRNISINGTLYQSDGNIVGGSMFGGYGGNSLGTALSNINGNAVYGRNRADDAWNRTQDIYTNYVSKSYVPTALASLGTGEIGTYGLMHSLRGTDQTVGGFYSGNELAWSTSGESYWGTPGGTWKLLGYIKGSRGSDGDQVSLFIRVS